MGTALQVRHRQTRRLRGRDEGEALEAQGVHTGVSQRDVTTVNSIAMSRAAVGKVERSPGEGRRGDPGVPACAGAGNESPQAPRRRAHSQATSPDFHKEGGMINCLLSGRAGESIRKGGKGELWQSWSRLGDSEHLSVCLASRSLPLRSRSSAVSSLYGIKLNCSLPHLCLKETLRVIWLIFPKVFVDLLYRMHQR